MAYLDDTGLAYFWGKIKSYIAALLAPKANDADVVHRTGDETVSGLKSFMQPSVVLQQPDIELTNDSSEYPNENKYLEIFLADKNYDPSTSTDPNRAPALDETRFGEIQWCRRPNGIDTFELTIRELDGDGNGIDANLGVGYNPSNGVFNGYCPSTSELRTAGTDIVTRDWIPKDTRIVHTTGNETIAGTKTFSGPIVLDQTTLRMRVLQSDSTYRTDEIIYGNSQGINNINLAIGGKGNMIVASGECGRTQLDALAGDYGEKLYLCSDSLIYFKTNCGNGLDTNHAIVLDTSNCFYGISQLGLADPDLSAKGTDPSIAQWSTVSFSDATGDTAQSHRLGAVESFVGTNGKTGTVLRAYNWVSGDSSNALMGIFYPRNGTPYTEAPTPAASDDSTKIATTEWVRSATGSTSLNAANVTGTVSIAHGGTGAATAIAAMNAIGNGEYYSSGSHDLNDFRQTGIYTFSTGATITNIPTGSNGTLIVFSTNSGIVRQLWIRTGTLNSSDHNFYFRSYISNTWSNWHRVYTDSDVIPIANGGTGSTTKNFVDLSTTQDFSGNKYGLNHFGNYGTHPNYEMINSKITKGSAPSSNSYGTIAYLSNDGKGSFDSKYRIAAVEMTLSTGNTAALHLLVYDQVADSADNAGVVLVRDSTSYTFRPNTNDLVFLGSANYKWKEIFAMTATINTSDERLKSEIGSVDGALLDAWEGVELCTFKFASSIAEKGPDGARVHSGVVAQRVRDALAAHGVDASRYGFFCHDAWDAEEEDVDEYGNVRSTAKPAGDQYAIRYEELLCIEAAYLRRENVRLKKRVSNLENRLADLELRLGSV